MHGPKQEGQVVLVWRQFWNDALLFAIGSIQQELQAAAGLCRHRRQNSILLDEGTVSSALTDDRENLLGDRAQ